MEDKTKELINEAAIEKEKIFQDEEKQNQRLSEVLNSHQKTNRDEEDLRRIRDKAIQDLEHAKKETLSLKQQEEEETRKLELEL